MPKQKIPTSSLISAITDQPVLVADENETLFASLLTELAGNAEFTALYDADMEARGYQSSDEQDDFWEEGNARFRPYKVTGGILQIPVYGVLLNRFGGQYGRYATGYQYIEKAFNRGMEDPEVKGIAFMVDSPGGEVAGNFELVENMAERRGEKPIRAFAADHAYSAAYSISTASDSIIMTRSGGVGSVGVVVAHAEYSKMMKDWGVTVTFIHAGKHKVDGNPYEKLSASAKERIQTRVDRIYGEFTSLVAANRGMEEEAVRATEALTYDASEAVDIGFADRVGALEEELAVFSEEADNTENELMTTKPKTPAASENTDGQITMTQAELDTQLEAARTEGATAERERTNAIMNSEEAATRPAAAKALAESGMDTETATATLAKMPEETSAVAPAEEAASTEEAPAPAPATSTDTGFAAAMSASGNPEVGADAPAATGNDGEPTAADNSANMLSALRAASGKKAKAA